MDVDGDSYGTGRLLHKRGPRGPNEASRGGDCGDNEASANPDGTEVCGNNIDEACDGVLDNGCEACDATVDGGFDGANACNDCDDYCGSDDYCIGAGTSCRLARSSTNLDGQCWPDASPLLGAAAVGESCTRDFDCDHGLCATDGAQRYCTEACCTDSDCPGGFHCSLAGDQVDTTYVTVPTDADDCTTDANCPTGQVCFIADGKCAWRLAETSPMCLRDDNGQGTRQAGAACAANGDCQSDFCEAELGVCVDVCCSDEACPSGLACELQTVQTSVDQVTSARVCVNLSVDGVLERR